MEEPQGADKQTALWNLGPVWNLKQCGNNPGHVQTDSFHSVSHLPSPLVCVPAGGFDAVIIGAAASPSSYCVCIPNIGGGEMTGTPAFPRGAPDRERPWLRAALIE